MKALIQSFVIAATLLGSAAATGPETVEAILKAPDKFHEKEVTVAGKVAEFKQKTSKKGNEYFVFRLKGQGDESLNVYARGKMEPALKDDDKVEVSGIYRKEKAILDFTVKNEVDASTVTKDGKKKFGVKLIKDQ